MNHCITLAQQKEEAKYITLFNGDDIYSEKMIEEQVSFMEANMNTRAVLTEGVFINQRKTSWIKKE